MLHRYGAPAHRIESTLEEVAGSLRAEGTFLVTPTSLIFEFGDAPVRLVRTSQGAVDLGGLAAVYAIAGRVVQGELSAVAGRAELVLISTSPRRYNAATMVVATMAASAAAACFLASTWLEVGVAAIAAIGVGILSELARHSRELERALPMVAAAAVTVSASLVAAAEPISVYTVTVCALIMFVPGLMLTTAMAEISTGHLVAGTSRLTSAAALLLALGVGVALGTTVATGLLGTPQSVPLERELGQGATVIGLLLGAASFQVLLSADRRDLGWVLASGMVAGIGLALPLPQYAAVFVGAFAIGLYGRLYVRIADRPAPVVIVPGILVLVPGSIGFQSVALMMSDDVLSGTAGVFQMLIIGMAIALGLVMSGALDAGNRPGTRGKACEGVTIQVAPTSPFGAATL
ncbi:MAG: uncharacterized membrane protein YjjP (DUF1212 family) [Bradymonadia bacterium]|jgi:uncharacterized membrane protein YjjP (DUF1212 family)